MKENDKITQLPKRTLSASNYVTPITNQANVANRLGETFGKAAHDLVWESEPADWEDKAREYVNLTYGNHYGTRWVNGVGTAADNANDHRPADNRPYRPDFTDDERPKPHPYPYPYDAVDLVSTGYPSPTPMAAILRLAGGEN